MKKLAKRTDTEIIQRILSEMDQFDFDVQEMNGFLSGISPDLSLEGNGRGTHFYILPAVETLKQDIELDAKETEDISKLRRQLFGFTNTMTSRRWSRHSDRISLLAIDDSSREILEAKDFWTPEDLDKADHRFTGSFDEYGLFRGDVRVFDQEPVDFVLPWPESRGKPDSLRSLHRGYRISFKERNENPGFPLKISPTINTKTQSHRWLIHLSGRYPNSPVRGRGR